MLPDIQRERDYALALIEEIIAEAPRRQPTSDDERRASLLVQEELARLGLSCSRHPFRFNDNLYKNLALHMGLGTLGTVVSPLFPRVAFGLHALCAGSYTLDSTRRAYVLRRVFGFRDSHNLVATLPAEGEPKLRIVIGGHIDAAFTGFIFTPEVVRRLSGDLPRHLRFLHRGLALAVNTQWALAALALLRVGLGPLALPLRPLELLLSIPALVAFVTSLEVVLRDEIVPGANDNLSAVAALPLLATRLGRDKPDDVELDFVVTGCEEASLGGADALARQMTERWDKRRTVVLTPDSLSGGELRLFAPEGEVFRVHPPARLLDAATDVARADPRFAEVRPFAVPVGGSDAAAFLCHGYDAMGLGCIDPSIGAPRHYHQPTDTVETLDGDKLIFCVDYIEALVRRLYETEGVV